MISVITATYNSMKCLPLLVDCLRSQTDKSFEWIVADGASTDGTLEYLHNISDLDLKVFSKEDFGVYDALNRGIKECNGDFYLVAGSDDLLDPDAIKIYKMEIDDSVDIVTGNIKISDTILKPKGKRKLWYYGMGSLISGHSIGCCVRKSLHDELGYYSRKFPICADQLFLGLAFKKNMLIKHVDKHVGLFGSNGLSSRDTLGMLTEFYRVQVSLGLNKYLQTVLFIMRLLKNIRKIYL